MTPGLNAWKCGSCGAVYFPERYLCPKCGGHEFETVNVAEGVIEDMTIVRHVLGQKDWQPKPIATVLIDGGARILAGVTDDAGPSDRVLLSQVELAPYVRRKS
jgi:uncharacterized OB-fold protein